MAGKVNLESFSHQNTSSGIRVEGDLGGLQIEELSDNDEERTISSSAASSKSLSQIPAGLVQSSTTPVFGSVAVTNSDNVQFGNNTFFNGPVTIKQVVHNKTGVDNNSFTRSDDEEPYDQHKTKLNRVYPKPTKQYYHKLQKWHIALILALCAVIVVTTCAILLKSNVSSDDSTEDGISKDLIIQMVDGSCYTNTQLTILIILMLCLFNPMAYILRFIKTWNIYNNLLLDEEEQLLIAAGHLRIVPREDWLAQPVVKPLDPIRQPVPWVIITHTAGYNCSTQSQCVRRVRLIQMFHVESNSWYDIGYNFLVGGDGSVYWGRGWDNAGAHTKGYNKYSIGIAFVGTFNNDVPPQRQLDACHKLIKLGVELKKIKPDYKLFAHRQLMSTSSPGDKLFDLMKTWPHFVNNTSDIDSLVPQDY